MQVEDDNGQMNAECLPAGADEMLVQAEDLWKIYRRGQEEVVALRGATLRLEKGAFVFVLGPSGGGKSTLLHLLGAVDRPSRGVVSVNGVNLDRAAETELASFRRKHIGFIFQFYNLLPALNAAENVALPLLANGWRRRAALDQAQELLRQIGLEDRSKHKPAQLSGGEQQRVAIARAVVAQPALVLADEPTGDLDAAASNAVVGLMRRLNKELKATFLIATHDEKLCQSQDRIWLLRDGQLETG